MIKITCLIICSLVALILKAAFRLLTEDNSTPKEKKVIKPEEKLRRVYRNAYYMHASIKMEDP